MEDIMNNKSKMYQNNVNKVFNNNKKVYFSYSDKDKYNNFSNDIRKKVNLIINGNDFIYTTKVNIIMDDKKYIKKIVGIKDNNLVTLDNEYIPIDKIDDIYKY